MPRCHHPRPVSWGSNLHAPVFSAPLWTSERSSPGLYLQGWMRIQLSQALGRTRAQAGAGKVSAMKAGWDGHQEFVPTIGTPGPTPGSDVDSVGGGSESRSLDSPTSSPAQESPMIPLIPGAGRRRLVKASSTGTESSDDFEERDPDLGDGLENGLGSPFRKWTLSSAAQTHRLRRLRGPAKCRECEAFMVSGTECEECFLTCHKRCLETLLILCGHRRLPARTPIFGVDFLQLPRDFPEEVPFVVTRCTAEIEHRALDVQGIYRVSGSRVRVERLCQAFENGRALVELSGNSPHDVSSVLKRFLQEVGVRTLRGPWAGALCSPPTLVSRPPFCPQLTDPVIPFHLYDAFISLAKTLHADPGDDRRTPSRSPEVIPSLKTLLAQLPPSNYNTLRHLVAHLFRCARPLSPETPPSSLDA
ncbi:hypothetical protein P7K49_033732 [Saguinus oedipus]|uniref:GEM-interacting protein n=1 Tax=Saguinus oedipus TaxID=9490 RepID=A0ABQ9TTL0_SAGOE|nr:hypothetical protein P7K49_033732 [Saguinus oedipus]